MVRLDFQGIPVFGDGLINLSAAGQRPSKFAMGVGGIWLDFQNLPEMSDCSVELPAVGQGEAEVKMGVDVFGFDFQGLPVNGDRLLAPSLSGQRQTEVVVSLEIFGINFQGLPEMGDRVVELPENTGVIYDLTSDEDANESFRMSTNTQAYVKYLSAPTMPDDGAFYLACVFGLGE